MDPFSISPNTTGFSSYWPYPGAQDANCDAVTKGAAARLVLSHLVYETRSGPSDRQLTL